jgi:hypothetical protein
MIKIIIKILFLKYYGISGNILTQELILASFINRLLNSSLYFVNKTLLKNEKYLCSFYSCPVIQNNLLVAGNII